MKHSRFYQTVVAIAMMLMGWLPSLAHDFEVDGICYNILSDNSVEVTYNGSSYNNDYEDVIIPETVTHDSVTNIDFKEIRERVLRSLIQKSIPVNPFCDLFYDDAEYIGFWNNKYVYRLYNEDYLEPNLWPCKYLLIDANSIEEYEDSNYIITNKVLPFCEK